MFCQTEQNSLDLGNIWIFCSKP